MSYPFPINSRVINVAGVWREADDFIRDGDVVLDVIEQQDEGGQDDDHRAAVSREEFTADAACIAGQHRHPSVAGFAVACLVDGRQPTLTGDKHGMIDDKGPCRPATPARTDQQITLRSYPLCTLSLTMRRPVLKYLDFELITA